MSSENPRDRDEQDANEAPARKAYALPVLRVYGDIAELTRTVGNVGALDGGSGNKHKTA